MRKHLYSLIRYVPDRQRMEPINVGLVLQDPLGTRVRFSPHAAKRSDVDTEIFRKWKNFFEVEVNGEVDPLFRPPTNSPAFLDHLAKLCDGSMLMSRPLQVIVDDETEPQEVLDGLFRRLVLPPEESDAPETQRPTGRYRELESEFQLLKRGVRRHALVPIEFGPHWRPYRQVPNGKFIAVDKIEVARELGRTANELNALNNIQAFLDVFLKSEVENRQTRYVLVADQLFEPFNGQSQSDFQTMKDDIERTAEIVRKAGGDVFTTPEQSGQFVRQLDEELPRNVAAA